MEFALSEEQVMIQDSFRGTLNRVSPLDRVRKVAEAGGKLDPAMWAGLVEMGMPSLMIPEEYGGAGLGLMEAAIVASELGRSVVPVPFVASAVMVPLAIELAGKDSQKSEWLPKLASGELRMAVAISETAGGAREDAGVRVEANKISGRVIFSLDAADADAYLVADGSGGLHIVAADAEGLADQELRTIDRTRAVNELRFDGVACDSLANSDPAIISKVIDAGRIILAADSLGAGEEMLRQAVDYAKERRQFDRVIASFQAVKHMCAEMASELEPCRALVWYAAYAFDNMPDEAPLQAALAKSHVDEVGRFVARTATEVHGGMGFTDLMGLHYWFKRIGFNRAVLGGPERVRAEAAVLLGL
jgi:alkylation response protein AidB-like acyl-CoA dehydrogenase